MNFNLYKKISPGTKKLFALVFEHKKAVALGVLSLLCVDVFQVAVPQIVQITIDSLDKKTATFKSLLVYGGIIVLFASLMVIFRFLWRYFLVGSSRKIERDLRLNLYNHLQKLSPQYYDKQKVGDILAHASNDIAAIQRAAGFGTLAALDAFVLGITVLIIMLVKNAQLTLICLVPLPILTIVIMKFGKVVHDRFAEVQKAFSSLTEKAQETISGIRVIKAYGDENTEQKFFDKCAKNCVDKNIQLAKIHAVFDPMITALAFMSMALLIGFGGVKVIKGTISLGEFVAFSSYLGMIIWPMIACGVVVNMIQRGAASLERIQKILDTKPDLKNGKETDNSFSVIKCKNLTFKYPETDVNILENINFSLPLGSFLGIVGRTGSGKTTLVELLMRLYDAPANSIFCDEKDSLDFKLQTIRKNFGYVPQEPFLFALSIAENISFGNHDLSKNEIIELAKLVKIHDEIIRVPAGYDAEVSERGVTLSGGQKQRIAIARALAVKPRILVMDDSLSAVDAETESEILKNLKTVLAKTTSIIIAHRISAVKNADNILVLDDKTIVDQGTHEELIQREGYYSELYNLQKLEEEFE